MSRANQIIVALDTQDKNELNQVLKELKGKASIVKVGMELFYTFGPSIVDRLKRLNFKVFLDLKIHDIPQTAVRTCMSLAKLGVDMINLHASGGIEMMSRVREELDNLPNRPLLLGVTHLTSTDQAMLEELSIERGLQECVQALALNTKEAGFDGVVASAQDTKMIKASCGEHFIVVTPGIRPKGSEADDQKRVLTPKEAIENGSDYLVIGRPIVKSAAPGFSFDQILQSIS